MCFKAFLTDTLNIFLNRGLSDLELSQPIIRSFRAVINQLKIFSSCTSQDFNEE